MTNYQLLYALIDELPSDRLWSAAERVRWLDAFHKSMDYLVDVREPVALVAIKRKQTRRRWTDERRAKFSEGAKGRVVSEETRRKISAAMKAKGIVPPWRRTASS